MEIALVRDDNGFHFPPLLHEVALGKIDARHIAFPIRRLH
jgi:NADH dehydrogenase FAD-containing subunit